MPSAVAEAAEAAEAVEAAEGVGAAAGAGVAAVASRGGLAASAERVIFSENARPPRAGLCGRRSALSRVSEVGQGRSRPRAPQARLAPPPPWTPRERRRND